MFEGHRFQRLEKTVATNKHQRESGDGGREKVLYLIGST